jgi:hypothetical protein
MSERERNQQVAEAICQNMKWDGREFRVGECVALLDGRAIGVASDLDTALQALRDAAPNPLRGMVLEVSESVTDVIR